MTKDNMLASTIENIHTENTATHGIWQDFEEQIQSIFRQVLVDSVIKPLNSDSVIKLTNIRYDFEFFYEQKHYIVEVKYYRTKLAQMRLLIGAAQQLMKNIAELAEQGKKYLPILVVSCSLSTIQKEQIVKQFPDLILVDRESLIITTASQIDLMNYLTPFFGVMELDAQNPSKDLLTLLKEKRMS